ncbi:hypothetical protein DICPUDRAFT_81105 [Dictyostelium purpureum]|uniref:Uncharacterized protein n=1 Tax=Dictyostelium purpureum TaxID=5786 RepID=F0ZSH8_DICPU|nr:uncharacterized protein DICPUDRAFT_81105 [Dictyostelium purpureum]EGC33105.1 hypothetical protein DICPUDRAFT_81105 [Dictyostelium purpureum]|eukprot:XP_003290382.1 hypothetical protein DICPUDRAFT_81105 [Dictyostelium purpureum]
MVPMENHNSKPYEVFLLIEELYLGTNKYPFLMINPLSQFGSFESTHFEIINYCLVSKKWKEYVVMHLTNALDFQNINFISPFMKLVNRHRSVKIYTSMASYVKDSKKTEFEYKKILIPIFNYDGFNKILYSRVEYPNNVNFETHIAVNKILEEDENSQPILPRNVNNLTISHYSGCNKHQIDQTIEIIGILKPKNIFINYDSFNEEGLAIWKPSIPYQLVKNLSNIISCPHLKRFRIGLPVMEPFHLLSLNNQNTKLKELHLSMDFDRVIKLLNGKTKYSKHFINPDNIQRDWDQMISILHSNRTIKKLTLGGNKTSEKDAWDETLSSTCITKGLKQLLSNQKCSIQTLELYSIDRSITDKLFFEGLALNTTISSITFCRYKEYIPFLRNIFPVNKTITNLNFYMIEEEVFFKILIELFNINNKNNINNINNIELYSISVYFQGDLSSQSLDKAVSEIKLYNLPIKQYNIYTYNCFNYKKQILLENNSIINLKIII